MKEALRRARPEGERPIPEGCSILELSNSADDPDGGLAPQEVGPGDVVLIPPSTRQRIANTGPGDLVFLAICTPRFAQDAYEDI